ncbi:MAG TPA: D-alanine--D-alanine ligase, partial [Candidatus Humimicrobiaceae bacterium]
DFKMKKNISENFRDFPTRKIKGRLKIGVISGGISSEREVSLSTGKGIYEALLSLGYRIKFIDFTGDIKAMLDNMDIAFLALHGKYGEDGTMQGLLELLKIPYTGSGVLASAIAMDKIYSKKIFEFENIPTPPYLAVDLKNVEQMDGTVPKITEKITDKIADKIVGSVGYPLIVKPGRGGSSIGVTIVQSPEGLDIALKDASLQDGRVLIEKFIPGKLLTVSIIGMQPLALPIIEIRPKGGFYDYRSKYTPGFTEYIVPAPIEKDLAGQISSFAVRCHNVLDCSAISRVDFIHGNDGSINVLEVNTIPGMTPTSLVPKAAAICGISYEMLTEIILNCASLKL